MPGEGSEGTRYGGRWAGLRAEVGVGVEVEAQMSNRS